MRKQTKTIGVAFEAADMRLVEEAARAERLTLAAVVRREALRGLNALRKEREMDEMCGGEWPASDGPPSGEAA